MVVALAGTVVALVEQAVATKVAEAREEHA